MQQQGMKTILQVLLCYPSYFVLTLMPIISPTRNQYWYLGVRQFISLESLSDPMARNLFKPRPHTPPCSQRVTLSCCNCSDWRKTFNLAWLAHQRGIILIRNFSACPNNSIFIQKQ